MSFWITNKRQADGYKYDFILIDLQFLFFIDVVSTFSSYKAKQRGSDQVAGYEERSCEFERDRIGSSKERGEWERTLIQADTMQL